MEREREIYKPYLEQTFCQSMPYLRPQKGAKEEQANFGPGNVCVIQESPFGELQTTRATVSQCTVQNSRRSSDELNIAWHGLHFHLPGAHAVTPSTVHCGAARKKRGDKTVLTPFQGDRDRNVTRFGRSRLCH